MGYSNFTWENFIEEQSKQAYFQQIQDFVKGQRSLGKIIYPEDDLVFNAFELTPLAKVKVVIIGQDPYHGEAQAHGLSFSVQEGVATPPSLQNIYKELQFEFPSFQIPTHGCLQSWAKQGVLLLNTVLTVEAGKPHSHAKCGWEVFTDQVVSHINEQRDGVVFLLWGAHAQKKGKAIDSSKHLVLKAPHPSPLSVYRGFWNCGHFKQINEWLSGSGKTEIDWMPVL